MLMNKLKSVSKEAITEFINARSEIIKEVVSRSMKVKEEIDHHGSNANQILTAGMEFTFKMLIASMQAGAPILLDDQAEWVKDRLPHDGISLGQMVNRIKRLMAVVEEKLPGDHAREINGYIAYLVGLMT
jgi:hypothetical protein